MLRTFKFYFAIAITIAACFNPVVVSEPIPEPVVKPKNIFLFIGDGMGFAHIAVAEAFTSLSFTQFPVMGMATTRSADSYVTCSAAAATALATGSKTNNGMIALDASGKPLRSMAFDFRDAGYKVGIATTVSIDHATPAAFYANDVSRNNYYSIASQLAPSGFDFFAGEAFLDPREVYEQISQAGYSVVYSKEEFEQVQLSQKLLMSQNSEIWTLADFVSIGIERLDNSQGFFFMAEGGKIDWRAHDNNGEGVVKEMAGFSDAIAVAFEFYKKHPNETLIVVTADHGTGGISLVNNREIAWTTTGHTGEAVPVFAIGAGSEAFAGKMDNTDIPKRILHLR
ncbi:MAG: alkaline phosphatase [Fibromonadales bacterium]|nr:alkaline phosphatase [Fibromonadales bacterium]